MDSINEVYFSSISIMSEHFVTIHPFVRESHMDTAGEHLLAGDGVTARGNNMTDERITMKMGEMETLTEFAMITLTRCKTPVLAPECPQDTSLVLTCQRTLVWALFVIPDAGNLGMSYYSLKCHRSTTCTTANVRSRPCAIREPTRGAVGKIIRLQYDLHDPLARHALAWLIPSVSGDSGTPLFNSDIK